MIGATEIFSAKVLIVDDQQANVLVLLRMLQGAGYVNIASTMDPTEVCALHLKNRYDLILLDLQMPVMDGFQVMEALKEIETGGYLPVLVLTAQPNQKLRALQAGAKDFVGKPFDLQEVLLRVYNMVEVRLLHWEERRRSELELILAQQTQESLLPRSLPVFENFQIHAYNNPTRYVGGDFYDFRQLDSGDWVGILADVSGKGIPAGLLSSMLLGALTMEFRAGTQPLEILNRMNWLLREKSLSFQFVTLFLLALNPQGAGQFLSAGHNTAYLFRSATGVVEELAANGGILGVFESVSYDFSPLQLGSGDILVIYSDGVTEAQSQKGEMFGEERLVELIRRNAHAGGLALKDALLTSIDEFTTGKPQGDDITFVLVEKRQAE